jgi:hypothetical protein
MTDTDRTAPVCRKPMESIILDDEACNVGGAIRGILYAIPLALAAWIIIAAWLALSE